MEITIKKIVLGRAKQEFGEPVEVVFERLLAEGNSGEAQEVILEVVQVPGDGLAIKAAARVANGVVEIARSVDLKSRQYGDDFAISLDDRQRDDFARPIALQKVEQRVLPRSCSR